MLCLNLLNAFSDVLNKATDYFKNVLDFLIAHLGSEIMAYVTLGVIGVLAVALLVTLCIAIINPAKRKVKKLNKTLKIQKEYDSTRQRILQISEEIGTINLEIRFLKKQFDDDVFNLNEIERSATEQDELFFADKQHRLDDLAEKQAILKEVLSKHQKGLFKNVRKDKVESTKLLIDDLVSQQKTCSNDIAQRTIIVEKRKAQLASDIETLQKNCDEKRNQLNDRRIALEKEKFELELKLSKMEEDGRHKLSFADAVIMTDEFTRQKKIADKEAEDAALAGLQKAKADYEAAVKKRIQTEKDKNTAVENVKAIQKERAKSKGVKSVTKYAPIINATAVKSEDKPDDVNIIIADINSTEIITQTSVTVQEVEVEDEHSYKEPTVEYIDVDNLPEEDVVFVEAFLDFLNVEADDETILDETAITETNSIDFNAQEEITVESVEISQETATETATTTLFELEPVEETEDPQIEEPIVETAVDVQPSVEIAPAPKKAPAYKDYNDGIPATPIHKKSKFQKPITKLVKKSKAENTTHVEKEPIAPTKTGYNGKWKIENANGKYRAKLLASNGGLLLTTPLYTSENGVKACIQHVKECLASDRATIVTDKDGKYSFKLISEKGRTVLQSATHSTKYQCEKSLASTKHFAETAVIC